MKYILLITFISIVFPNGLLTENSVNSFSISIGAISYIDTDSVEGTLDSDNSSMFNKSSHESKIEYISKYNFGIALKHILNKNINSIYASNYIENFYSCSIGYHFKEREKIPLNLSFEGGGRINKENHISNFYNFYIYKEFKNLSYPVTPYLIYSYNLNNLHDTTYDYITLGLICKLIVNDLSNTSDSTKDNIWFNLGFVFFESDKYISFKIGLSHPFQS